MTYETFLKTEMAKPENKNKSVREIAEIAGQAYWNFVDQMNVHSF